MKITKGDWEAQEDSFKGLKGLSVTSCDLSAPLIIAFLWADGCEEIQIQQKANAALIADAGTVHNDTGYTPSQLLEARDGYMQQVSELAQVAESLREDVLRVEGERDKLLDTCKKMRDKAIKATT